MTDAPPPSDGRSSSGPIPDPAAGFPVVGIGASAGGLAALRELFAHVPAKSGAAYVVVVHLSPEHESVLDELLQPHVSMPVRQVYDSVELKADHVYVIPPNANLEVTDDIHLRSSTLEPHRHERAPIDHFFRTLASSHVGRAIGVILSGTGSDGALGLRQIKEYGGLTVVQDPCDAEYDGMPRSAIAAAPIDLVLPVREIPAAILRFMHIKPELPDPMGGRDAEREADRLLKTVFSLIRVRTGRDFSAYKRSTLLRRIGRRMRFHLMESASDYIGMLRQEPEEVYALADDLLITVTRFFRDAEVFAHLQQRVIPALFDSKDTHSNMRVWSVACATGEEAYSLAILLFEESARRDFVAPFHVFATDLHRPSLEIAREGFYPSDIANDISPERLARFFQPEDGGYRIRQEIRERIVFAPHNLMGDPPFSRIDMISCRNLLIYLRRELQQKVTELFHYALKPDGTVLLGTSEALDAEGLFRIIDKGHGIYRKRNVPVPEPRLPVFPMTQRRPPPALEGSAGGEALMDPITLHRTMVDQLGPASVLVSPDDKIIHFSGRAGRYMAHPGGLPTTSVYRLVREELCIELRTAIPSARGQKTAISTRPIPVRFNGTPIGVVLHVHPTTEPGNEGFVLVFFEELSTAFAQSEALTKGTDEVSHREEHRLTQERLQAIIKDYETSQEELRASNEELQSANEELRSTMEELETSKEELQSMNEELQTVNQENRHRVEELDQLSRDLQHLLAATDIATLFLDREQRIMRFTPRITSIFNLRGADRGRPLADFSHRLGYDRLHDDVASVLEHRTPIEREIQDEKGTWYLTRLLPYRSAEDLIGGVVLTFLDITERLQSEHALRESKGRYRALAEMNPSAILVNRSNCCAYANSAAARLLGAKDPEEVIGRSPFELFEPEDHGAVREYTRQVLEERRTTNRIEYRWRRLDGTPVDVEVIAGPVDWKGMLSVQVVARDITERKQAEEAMRAIQEERYHTLFELIDEGFCIIELLLDDNGRAADYRFVDVNPAFAKHTGLADALGRRMRELVPEYEQRWFDVYGEVAATGKSVRFQHHSRALDRSLDVYALRVGKAGEHRVALLVNDITAQRRLEDQLRSTAEELSRASMRKDEYLAMLGHELRNPLAAIRSAIEVIEHVGVGNERLAPACSVLQRQSTHMSQLVDGLIDVARIAKGKVRLDLERLDLGALLGPVVDERAASVASSGVELESSLPPEPMWLRGDRVRLVQVFDHLIDNAIKFTPPPGRITVTLEREGDLAMIRVRDNGVGLRPEVLTRIFEPFHQEPQDSARTAGGLGLGLALAKGLVELHRGSLEARSEGRETGAEFVVRLPVVSPLTGPMPASKPSYRILVVEDNLDAANILGQLLELVGHRVMVAHDGAAALDALHEERADVVLCDLGLPGMNGYELAGAIREDSSLNDVCLIALTGYGQPTDRQRAIDAGFDEHLVKPVSLDVLSAIFERLATPIT